MSTEIYRTADYTLSRLDAEDRETHNANYIVENIKQGTIEAYVSILAEAYGTILGFQMGLDDIKAEYKIDTAGPKLATVSPVLQ